MRVRTIGSHLAAAACGSLMLLMGQEAYRHFQVSRDLAILTSSREPIALKAAVSRLLCDPQQVPVVAMALTTNLDGKRPTCKAREFILKGILESPWVWDIPRNVYEATVIRADPAERQRALDAYEVMPFSIYSDGFRLLLKRLPNENDPVLYNQKLGLICRYMYLDEAELQAAIAEHGIRPVMESLRRRLPALTVPVRYLIDEQGGLPALRRIPREIPPWGTQEDPNTGSP